MKKLIIGLAVLLVAAFVASAATISYREVRDPKKLRTWLETNISDVSGTATNIAGASIVSGNIAVARITNAMASAGATIGGNIPAAALTNAAGSVGSSIGGNIPAAALTNAVIATIQPAYSSGKFSVVGTTQLVFIASGVTNVIDADITTP